MRSRCMRVLYIVVVSCGTPNRRRQCKDAAGKVHNRYWPVWLPGLLLLPPGLAGPLTRDCGSVALSRAEKVHLQNYSRPSSGSVGSSRTGCTPPSKRKPSSAGVVRLLPPSRDQPQGKKKKSTARSVVGGRWSYRVARAPNLTGEICDLPTPTSPLLGPGLLATPAHAPQGQKLEYGPAWLDTSEGHVLHAQRPVASSKAPGRKQESARGGTIRASWTVKLGSAPSTFPGHQA
ncbi:hypothetical protein GQ53DRAFT_116454 [Thozetella sp. PMI_491]|nr:hypothetical protein GQ53DRAFT_116454 [Thozetella sp. PMI_491]